MTDNFDAEAAKKIICEENVNVTQGNPLKDLLEILINLVIAIICNSY